MIRPQDAKASAPVLSRAPRRRYPHLFVFCASAFPVLVLQWCQLRMCACIHVMLHACCANIYSFFCLSASLPLCLSVSLSLRLSISLSLCLSVYLSLCLSITLYLCLSVSLSLCLSVSLYVCMYVCMLQVYLPAWLHVSKCADQVATSCCAVAAAASLGEQAEISAIVCTMCAVCCARRQRVYYNVTCAACGLHASLSLGLAVLRYFF